MIGISQYDINLGLIILFVILIIFPLNRGNLRRIFLAIIKTMLTLNSNDQNLAD